MTPADTSPRYCPDPTPHNPHTVPREGWPPGWCPGVPRPRGRKLMSTEYHNREGQPMRPLGYVGDGPDFEVYRRSEIQHGFNGWHWQAYSRDRLLDSGDARTRTGLAFALWCARRRLTRQLREDES